jgi:hypothetical protein
MALDDGGRARRGSVRSGTGERNAKLAEPVNGRSDRRGTIVDVIGDADHADAGVAQCLAADPRRGEEAFILQRMRVRRVIEAAFQIAEHDVGGTQFIPDAAERHPGVVDMHQIDVTGENHAGHAAAPSRVSRFCLSVRTGRKLQ